jgi:hypothetical protein
MQSEQYTSGSDCRGNTACAPSGSHRPALYIGCSDDVSLLAPTQVPCLGETPWTTTKRVIDYYRYRCTIICCSNLNGTTDPYTIIDIYA